MSARMIILAAGEGQRLRPLTEDRPKCLVEVGGKPLIDWQIEIASRLGIRDIIVVTGHRAEQLKTRGHRRHHNPDYATTNMVETLWRARQEFHGEIVISYGDIVYEESVLQALLDSPAFISVVVDLGWRAYWELRFSDPLREAETLRLDRQGRILEIGQTAETLAEIQGQYIGLIKFRGSGIDRLKETYAKLRARGVVGPANRPFQTIYMTDLLQAMIETGEEVRSVPIRRKWLEIDSLADYTLANQRVRSESDRLQILV